MPRSGRIRCLTNPYVPLRCLAAGLLLLAAGCQSGRIRARDLPAALHPPRVDNVQTLDLSKLAANNINRSRIGPGDVLQVTISAGLSEEDQYEITCRVKDDGTCPVSIIGDLHLAGLELEAAEAIITEAAVRSGYYRAPTIVVEMKSQSVNRVTVVGAVKEQGIVEVPRGASDLLTAITLAGGLAEDAGTIVELRRDPNNLRYQPRDPVAGAGSSPIAAAGHSTQSISRTIPVQPIVQRLDLVSVVKSGAGTNALKLGEGDVVFVERRDPQPIYVQGLVHKPGEYEMPVGRELTVLDAIALASGESTPVADKVFVIRQLPHMEQPKVIEVSIRRAKLHGNENIVLAPGDRVSVQQTPATIVMDTIRMLNFGVGASLNTLF